MNHTKENRFLRNRRIVVSIVLSILLPCLILSACQPSESIPEIEALPEGNDLIAFTRGDSQVDLFIISADTSIIWKWNWGNTNVPDDISMRSSISWSPQKQVISFSGYSNIQSREVGFILSPTGDIKEIQLTGIYSEHSWSPDGTKIALSYPDDTSNRGHDIYIQDVNNLELQRLVSLPTDDDSPSWATDGGSIVFDSYDFDKRVFTVHQVRVDGTELRTLATEIGGNNRQPQWSPNSMKIAFLHSDNIQQPLSLWIMDVNGINPKPIFIPDRTESESLAGGVRSFAWSPDGQRLVFASGHEGPCRKVVTSDAETTSCEERIYIINIDGTGLNVLTPNPQPRHYDLAWIR